MNAARLADACWAATLVSLPLAGVGLIHGLTGRDFGAGLQPAYALLILTWLLRLVGESRRLWQDLVASALRPGWLLLGSGLVVVLVSGLGLWLAPAPVLGHEAWPRFWRQVVQLGLMLAFTVQAWLWTRGPRRWRLTLRCLAMGLVVQLIYAPLQGLMALVGPAWLEPLDALATSNPSILSGSTWLYLGEYLTVPRLRGTMCEPLYLGSFLLMVLPLLAAAGRRRLVVAGVLLLGATWSRGAWLAAVVGVVTWLVLARRARLPRPGRRWWLAGAGVVGAGLAVVALVSGPDTLLLPWRRLTQTLDGTDWSNLTRLYSAQAAWRAFLISPVVGIGWGQFAYHFYDLVDLSGLQSQFTWPVVGSIPLLVLAETGVLGAGMLVTGLVLFARRTWRRAALPSESPEAIMSVALAVATTACATQLLLFSQYNLPHLWVLPGLWLAIHWPPRGEE